MQIRGFYHFPLPLTAILAAICAILFVYLTIQVVRLRFKSNQYIGSIETDEFVRRNGALTNFANTTPFVLILFALAELGKFNCGVLFFIGGIYTLVRIVHIYSLYSFEIKAKTLRLRIFSMVTTFAVILALAGINLYIAACYF